MCIPFYVLASVARLAIILPDLGPVPLLYSVHNLMQLAWATCKKHILRHQVIPPSQTSRSCGNAGTAFLDSGGPTSIVKSPNICCFVAKSGLSRFTPFLGVRFSAFDSNKYCQIGQ